MEDEAAKDATVQLFDDLVRCETRLYNALGETLRAEHHLSTTQFEYLRYFRDNPGSRVAQVAANFAAGIGAISKGVDRLEQRGWVVRHPNPTDGRSSLLSLTQDGARLVTDAEQTFRTRLAALVGPALAPREIASTGKALAALRALLEESRAGVPAG